MNLPQDKLLETERDRETRGRAGVGVEMPAGTDESQGHFAKGNKPVTKWQIYDSTYEKSLEKSNLERYEVGWWLSGARGREE